MIDLEKEREAFESCVNIGPTLYLQSVDSYEGATKFVGENHVIRAVSGWNAWKKCAESKQAEIDSLKAQLAKVESGEFVMVPKDQLYQWGHMANYAQEYGCPECFEARGYAHSLACEINEYLKPVDAAQENSHE